MSKIKETPPGKRQTATSIDRQIEEISGKILTGQHSDALRADLERLQAARRDSIFSGTLRGSFALTRSRRLIKHPA